MEIKIEVLDSRMVNGHLYDFERSDDDYHRK